MNTYLGKLAQNPCRISDKATNNSILISGISGSGKTSRLLQMELQSSIIGNTVIVIDTGNSHSLEELCKLIPTDTYFSNVNQISAMTDGLNIPLFRPFVQDTNQFDSAYQIISTVTNTLSQALNLGLCKQPFSGTA